MNCFVHLDRVDFDVPMSPYEPGKSFETRSSNGI